MCAESENNEKSSGHNLITRQPVFDSKRSLFGYDIIVGDEELISIDDGELSREIFREIAEAIKDMAPHTMLFIPFPGMDLSAVKTGLLPASRCVFTIHKGVPFNERNIEICREIKSLGCHLALDGFRGQKTLMPFLKHADVVRIDVRNMELGTVSTLIRRLQVGGKKLVANNVHSWVEFGTLSDLGFDYLQGLFYCNPEKGQDNIMNSNMASRVELMKALSAPDCDMDILSEVIEKDPSLSCRLLKFINSAAFSFRAKVNSISQAVTLLGWQPMKYWIQAILISDIDSSEKGHELSYLALQRSKCLQLMAETTSAPPLPPHSFFLMGLISRLDALMGVEMSQVLSELPLSDEITKPLLGEHCPAREWLDVLEAVERADWTTAREKLKKCGLKPGHASVAYLQASSWAGKLVQTVSCT